LSADVATADRVAVDVRGKVVCSTCGTFMFAVTGGDSPSIVIKQRHHGQTHVSEIPLSRLLAQASPPRPATVLGRTSVALD
jgi:hypothetical protein